MSDYFIDGYVSKISEVYDIPIIFQKASGYHLIASLLGRFFSSYALPGVERPNIWIAMSSIPGRMRRSTIQWIDGEIYKKGLTLFWDEIDAEFKDKTGFDKQNQVSDTIIEEGTPEGISDHLTKHREDIKCYDIQGSEFGAIFQKMSGSGYEAGVPSLLSKLYSGEGGKVLLSQRGGYKNRYIPPNLFVNMLIGLQEPELYITPMMIRQGLMRRIILCYVDEPAPWKPLLNPLREDFSTKIDNFASVLSEKMVEFRKMRIHNESTRGIPFIDCAFLPNVEKKINDFAKGFDDAVAREPTNLNIVKQTLGLHLAKLCMLEAIEKDTPRLIGKLYTLNINDGHFSNAYNFLMEATEKYDIVIPRLGRKREIITTSEEPLEMVYRVIAGAGTKGISQSELLHKTHMKVDVLSPLLGTLVARRDIVQILDSSTGGRKPTRWKSTPKKK